MLPPPKPDPILLFYIHFHPKAPPSEIGAPPMGNPGSALDSVIQIPMHRVPVAPQNGPWSNKNKKGHDCQLGNPLESVVDPGFPIGGC